MDLADCGIASTAVYQVLQLLLIYYNYCCVSVKFPLLLSTFRLRFLGKAESGKWKAESGKRKAEEEAESGSGKHKQKA
jgi:hypothetical protein